MPIENMCLWQRPVPLDEREIKPWPRGVFPEPFDNFVSEVSRSTETPIELAALLMMASVSTVVQGKIELEVKPQYSEPLNIWTCVALPPGSRKSQVQGACVAPIVAWERAEEQRIRPLYEQHESLSRTQESRLRSLRSRAGNADEANYAELAQEIAKLESENTAPPKMPQLWTSDSTPESLATIMAENDERMSVLSDEGGIFETIGGRYSGGIPNLDLVLKAHSGTPCRINRGGRPPIVMQKPCLTMGLSPQPSVLEGLARNEAFRGRGLLARFLYAIPPSNLGYRSLDEAPMAPAVTQAYQEAIEVLIAKYSDPEKPSKLTLSEEAHKRWKNYAKGVEIRMQEDGIYYHLRDWAGKFPGAIARIAGLLHVMTICHSREACLSVSEPTMKAAISIGHCLQFHALAVFDLMGGDPRKLGAKRVLKWLRDNPTYEFSQRDCHYGLKKYFKRVAELKPSLELLEELNYIRGLEREKVAHRPSRKFEVNPFLYENGEEESNDG